MWCCRTKRCMYARNVFLFYLLMVGSKKALASPHACAANDPCTLLHQKVGPQLSIFFRRALVAPRHNPPMLVSLKYVPVGQLLFPFFILCL